MRYRLVMIFGLALLLAVSWAVLYQIVRQQGRLLLRLDEVDARLHGRPAPSSRAVGLVNGAAFGDFQLDDLNGQSVSLAQFVGKRLLLVNWDPACHYCTQLAPALAQLSSAFRERNVEVVLAAGGEADANRACAEEHGLACTILLRRAPLAAFAGLGTPVAYLVDADGRVAEPLAVGADEVRDLARKAASLRMRLGSERPLNESRIERHGISPGAQAPAFALPDLHGRIVALDDYRGRKVLLVFSDPNCPPCDELAPALARFHIDHEDELAILMIGRGDPIENRRKSAQFGFRFPVAIQPGWKLSKEYGIFATPVGFLIDENGVIASSVARGGEQILSLAQGAS